MSLYRFHPAKGLRKKGTNYKDFGISFDELDEEQFDDREDFCQAIASQILELLSELDEGEGDDADESD